VKDSSNEEEPKGGKSKKSKKSKDSKEEDKKLSKRQLKNAPIVVSAKAPLSRRPRQVVQLPKQETRDPRFDGLSGTFSEETFRKSYGFIDDIKKGEIVQLKQAIRKERRYDERAKLREALQIMENRMRSDKQKQKQKEIIRQHKKQEREKVRQGKNPYFLKEKRVKEMELEKKFEELKSKGGDNEVERYLRDKRKRKAQKEVRFMPFKRRAVEGADGSPMPAGN
jgi:ribosomal RNA-processing protein 36